MYKRILLKLSGEADPRYGKVRAIVNMFPGNNDVRVFFADTRKMRGAKAALDERMIAELENVLGKENVVVASVLGVSRWKNLAQVNEAGYKASDDVGVKYVEVEGRKRTYRITDKGLNAYEQELRRLEQCVQDAEKARMGM